jgi:hypothetical protein
MDDFDWGDATLLGGIIGFAEESMREEDAIPEELDDPDVNYQEPANSGDLIIRLFKSGHPKEYEWLVKKVIEQRLAWAEAERQRLEKDEEELFFEEIERNLYDEGLA